MNTKWDVLMFVQITMSVTTPLLATPAIMVESAGTSGAPLCAPVPSSGPAPTVRLVCEILKMRHFVFDLFSYSLKH